MAGAVETPWFVVQAAATGAAGHARERYRERQKTTSVPKAPSAKGTSIKLINPDAALAGPIDCLVACRSHDRAWPTTNRFWRAFP